MWDGAIWLLIHGILQFPTLYPLINQHTHARSHSYLHSLTHSFIHLQHTQKVFALNAQNVIKINVYVDVFTNNVINFFQKVLTISFFLLLLNSRNGGEKK